MNMVAVGYVRGRGTPIAHVVCIGGGCVIGT